MKHATTMKSLFFTTFALFLLACAAWAQQREVVSNRALAPAEPAGLAVQDEAGPQSLGARRFGAVGAVYTMTNETGGNAVVVYDRYHDGSLSYAGSFPTGGAGSGGSLGNQGGLILSNNHKWLFAVNAGSNEISVFQVTHRGITLRDIVPSGGIRPVSLTFYRGLLYVLNAGSDSIAAFVLGRDAALRSLSAATQNLSGTNTAPAQVLFSEDGDSLVVSEKATNKITAFHIDRFGYAIEPKIRPSAGATPFGMAFGRNHQLFVSEANGGIANASSVSSYVLDEENNEIEPISRTVSTGQTAACWIVLTPDNRFAFVSNTDSNSISSYRISFSGALTLLQSRAATTGAGPIDMTMSSDGRYLYALNRAGGSLSQYQVETDGRLTPMRNRLPLLPTSANGLAAR